MEGLNLKNINSLKESMLLYAVTDRTWLQGTLAEDVEKAIQGGATFLQLREKELDEETFLKEAAIIKAVTNKYCIPFVINDNVDIAVAVDADGVHVGQSDMETGEVRRKLGNDKIIGVSVQTVEQALLAQSRGADYLGVGAVFKTDTKLDASVVTYDTLREICNAVSIPVVAIGGISSGNIADLKGSGIDGIAVVSAIFAQKDIIGATKELKRQMEEIKTRE